MIQVRDTIFLPLLTICLYETAEQNRKDPMMSIRISWTRCTRNWPELQSAIDQLKLDYDVLSIKMSGYQQESIDNAENIKLIKAEINSYFMRVRWSK